MGEVLEGWSGLEWDGGPVETLHTWRQVVNSSMMALQPLTCVLGMAGTRLYHQHFTSKLPCLLALGGFDYPESLYFLR